MEAANRICLDVKRSELRETVVFKYIAAHLLKDGVVSSEEFQIITGQPTKQAQMDCFIELLASSKDSAAYASFVSSLDEDYPWLAADLRNLRVSSQQLMVHQFNAQNQTNDRFSRVVECRNQEVTLDVVSCLQQNARLVRRWSALAHRLGLDRQAQCIKVRVNMNCEDQDQCLVYLIQEWKAVKAKEANLSNLIGALKAEQFNDVAVQLESQSY